jgi:hypothetical protein
LRNAGAVSVRMAPLAVRLDSRLVAPPAHPDVSDAPKIGAIRTRKASNLPGVRNVTIPVESASGAVAPMLTIFSKGEVVRNRDRLVYRAVGVGDDELVVYALAPGPLASSRRFRISP